MKNFKFSLILSLLSACCCFVLVSCGGVSSNIYIIADTSMPDESVEYEFCRETGTDDYPITNYNEEEK